MKKDKLYLPFLFAATFLIPFLAQAQENNASPNSYFSNAMFNILFSVIILLLILIAVIGNVIRNVSKSDYFKNKVEKNRSEQQSKTTIVTILFLISGYQLSAQTVSPSNDWLIGGLDMTTFFTLLFIILCEVSILAVLLNVLKRILKSEKEVVVKTQEKPINEKNILDTFNASVSIEDEQDILLDHDYDGIKELDNNLPPWWKYGFYLTILIAVIYLSHYHLAQTGDLQEAEYNKSVAKAKAEIAEYMKNAANNVDENTVTLLVGEDIQKGKEIYIANCAACHGKLGEGTVGPNLTDNYWLHSGGISDIFKSIKYGWVDKGMKSWKEDLSPMQIAQVTSFIKSAVGSNPPNAKAPQGELYNDKPAVKSDSAQVKVDSLAVAVIDSLKK
jgi:cytochrome c oxidase cbb3-type subunit 3